MTMIKPSQRLYSRTKSISSGAALPRRNSGIDTFLQRLSHLTQIGLFALGIFGYFYTVLPVFQNQQLQEQAAKLELEKSAAQRRLDELQEEQVQVKSDIASLRDNWSKERARNTLLLNEAKVARQEGANAERRKAEVELALSSNLRELDASRWELVMSNFAIDRAFISITSAHKRFNRERSASRSAVIDDSVEDWPQPHAQLLEALEITQNRKGPVDIPSTYYAELRSFIDSRQADLQCFIPDFQALRASYQLQLAAIENSLDGETEASIAKLQEEYVAKGKKIQITEEFRQSTRISVRAGREYTLDASFRKKLNGLRDECSNKIRPVIDAFRKSKNLRG